MVAEQDFLDAGYRRFSGFTGATHADYGLQKLFFDKFGKQFYITISVYDWRKYPQRGGEDFTFEAHTQFRISDSILTNLSFVMQDITTVTELETHYHEYWINVGRPYYEIFKQNN